nr:MAG TPA: hypothetical protein [Caudoviricetes sp.]
MQTSKCAPAPQKRLRSQIRGLQRHCSISELVDFKKHA